MFERIVLAVDGSDMPRLPMTMSSASSFVATSITACAASPKMSAFATARALMLGCCHRDAGGDML
jgi:hypothetical protein